MKTVELMGLSFLATALVVSAFVTAWSCFWFVYLGIQFKKHQTVSFFKLDNTRRMVIHSSYLTVPLACLTAILWRIAA